MGIVDDKYGISINGLEKKKWLFCGESSGFSSVLQGRRFSLCLLRGCSQVSPQPTPCLEASQSLPNSQFFETFRSHLTSPALQKEGK